MPTVTADQIKQLAGATLKYLRRVDLKGGEVEEFVVVHNWLQSMRDMPLESEVMPEGEPEPRPRPRPVDSFDLG